MFFLDDSFILIVKGNQYTLGKQEAANSLRKCDV